MPGNCLENATHVVACLSFAESFVTFRVFARNLNGY